MRTSLFFRLMGAFALVLVIGLAIVYVIANQATANEFQYYMVRGQMVAAQDIVNQLAEQYRARGNWEGADALLRSASPGRGMGMMGGAMMGAPTLWLVDTRGVIIGGSDNTRRGQQVSHEELTRGTPIRSNGQTVGTLLVDSAMMSPMSDASSQEFLRQVNFSLLVAGLVAALVAMALGFVLFRQITAPLDALTQATQQVAAGDLHARAQVRGEDEISRLGRSFNVMAENLERSETSRRNMLADVAHELRNPLGVLQSHLEAIQDGVFPTTPEQIASLHDETMLLTRLVDDLREIALADAGQLSLRRESADLCEIARRTAAAFRAEASEHSIALTCDTAREIPSISIDAHRIEQVLRNLISNALRHTRPGGAITVRITREENQARVSVSDTGSGIPADALDHVFQRFWRGDPSRTRVLGGAGLGLAIAKQWIEAHGGKIGVLSQVDQGTTFWFTLPL